MVLLAVLSGVIALPTTATARQAPDPVVDLTLTELNPVTLTLDRTLRVGGQLRLLSGFEVRDTQIQLEVGSSPVTARSALDEVVQDPGYTVPVTGGAQSLGRLPLGRPIGFRIRVGADTLPLGVTGVYPLRLVVTGVVRGVTTEVTSMTTLLPWYPAGDQVDQTRLMWLWPIMDGARRDETGVFTSDTLADSMAPTGRLGTLVDVAVGRPVTWFVDPALLADASAMAGGYQVATADQPERGLRGDEARQWLEELSAASSSHPMAIVPYGDVDVGSVLDAGYPGLVRSASRWGSRVTTSVLGRPVERRIAWPDNGVTDGLAVDRMSRAGEKAVILSGALAQPVTTPAYTPSGRATVGEKQVSALLTDPTLDALVAQPLDDQPLLARQRFLAQTLLITVELPSDPRLVTIAPPRRWSPDREYADALLEATTRAAWLRPVSLDKALAWPVPTLERQPLPEDPPSDQFPALYVDQANQGRADTLTFGGILTDPLPIVPGYQAAFYSALSTVWRSDLEGGTALLEGATERLGKERSKVRIVSRGGTITSDSGRLPITVANDLDQAVVVGLDVESTDQLRLQVTAPDRVRVQSGGRVSVDASVNATTSGNLSAIAQLTTPAGRAYEDPVTLDIRVRAYGQVALLVFGGATALLVLAAAVRVVRRIMVSRSGGGAPA